MAVVVALLLGVSSTSIALVVAARQRNAAQDAVGRLQNALVQQAFLFALGGDPEQVNEVIRD
jgi:hypothetical protein